MGQFNHFVNNENIPSFNEVLRSEPYLTDANRNKLQRARTKENMRVYDKMTNLTQKRVENSNVMKLVVSPLQLGFFNAIVNREYDAKAKRINLENVIKPIHQLV